MSIRVKLLHWVNGVLQVIEHAFEELEEAIGFANEADCHSAKVIDSSGKVVHHVTDGGNKSTDYA